MKACLASISIGLALFASGCAVTPPRVDPYSTLLPPGQKVADSPTTFSPASLKQETAYLVVGANFIAYVDAWNKFQKSAEQGGNLAYSQAFLLQVQEQWSPAKTTSLVVTSLQKHFRDIVVVDDLAEARAKRANWVVVFDHAFIQTSTATATWTNSTSIDLLDGTFSRVVASAVSEHKDYGAAWNGESDVKRFARNRGDDVVRSVRAAIRQFDTRLLAAR